VLATRSSRDAPRAMTQHVLITGISGFVGGALGRHLRAQGARVTGISRRPPTDGACDRFIQHDLALPLSDTGSFDAIVHCAALASPWASPADYERNNVRTLESIIAFAQTAQPKRFVFVSSSAVHYAYRDQENIDEETAWPASPVNLYAASKRTGEAMVRASGLRWTIARPRAVFGAGDTVVFPRILHAAKLGVLPLLIRRDGHRPRADLLHIDNLCFYLARILELDADGAFLLTNNEPVETQSMLNQILERLGLPLPKRRVTVPVAMAAAGVMEIVSRVAQNWREPAATRFGVASLAYSKTFDVSRALAKLGAPPVSLEQGFTSFIEWQRPRLA
jgi:2-alkyl-3-oxoalkanoate reductase